MCRGQNPLHLLGQYGKDNAAAMFELFREAIPDYPIDRPDAEGNTGMWGKGIHKERYLLLGS